MGFSVNPNTSGPIQPRWLRLADAVAAYGLSKHRLKALALAKEIIGGPDQGDRRGRHGDGAWIFFGPSIDQWWFRQLGGKETLGDIAKALAGDVLS